MAEAVQEVAGQAQEKAGQAADQARTKVREQVDQRSTQIGEQISSNASDARSVADELRKQGKDGPARMADQAADRVERVGSYLTEADGDRILHDVEDFGRRNPWAAALGGLAIGFAASRLLKASSSRRYQSSYGDGSHGGSYGGASYGRGTPGEQWNEAYDETSGQLPASARTGATAGTGGL
jgi:ElaB/YqjD/DUF883 family membrane-anchored ribosome-binding protein